MKRILVLQLKRIGDLILTTPALAALREAHPKAHIVLGIMEGCAGLAPILPGVDEVLVFRRKGGNAAIWMKMAVNHFDLCLDFTGNDRSAFLSLLSKANERITFRWVRKSGMRSLFYNRFVDSSVRENHTVDHYLDLLGALEIPRGEHSVTLQLHAAHRACAATLLSEGGIQGDFVLIHPGTARTEKYWLPERWAEVIAYCRECLRLPCVLTGARSGYEDRHLSAILSHVSGEAGLPPLLDLSGRLDLPTLAALIARARLLLSMDSAPVHFGAAFGTPQISLFGPTNPFHWRARHSRAVTLVAGDGAATLSAVAPRRMLSDLSTQEVTDAITKLSP